MRPPPLRTADGGHGDVSSKQQQNPNPLILPTLFLHAPPSPSIRTFIQHSWLVLRLLPVERDGSEHPISSNHLRCVVCALISPSPPLPRGWRPGRAREGPRTTAGAPAALRPPRQAQARHCGVNGCVRQLPAAVQPKARQAGARRATHPHGTGSGPGRQRRRKSGDNAGGVAGKSRVARKGRDGQIRNRALGQVEEGEREPAARHNLGHRFVPNQHLGQRDFGELPTPAHEARTAPSCHPHAAIESDGAEAGREPAECCSPHVRQPLQPTQRSRPTQPRPRRPHDRTRPGTTRAAPASFRARCHTGRAHPHPWRPWLAARPSPAAAAAGARQCPCRSHARSSLKLGPAGGPAPQARCLCLQSTQPWRARGRRRPRPGRTGPGNESRARPCPPHRRTPQR
eukprot:scaffold10488_cov121-Isochrysis_galbana.AAC.2